MDFKLSYNWLKEFVDIRWTPDRIAEQLSLHSVSVERLHRLGDGLDRIIVGRIDGIRQHPNADRLRLVSVAIAVKGKSVEVVCGGTNLGEGMLIAYATVGAKVRWHGEGELVELKPTEIRGVRSEGMICSASEIGLGEWFHEGDHEILDLSFLDGISNLKFQISNPIGQPLARALGLDDVIFDIEVTTNRPDLMSVEELARETAVITGSSFRPERVAASGAEKSRSIGDPSASLRFARDDARRVDVRIDDRVGCPRYGAVVIDGVQVRPSPWWMQVRLLTAGFRPVNNIVDATNYAMLELGQPLHAFDAHRVQPIADSRKPIAIVIRRSKKGEHIVALDGVTYELSNNDVVIADAERPIAIAGIIGGQESGVTEATTRVVLECANFDPIAIRKTSRQLSVRTDAAIRFEKGLQPDAIENVLPRAIELIVQVAGGTVGKPVVVGQKPKAMRPIAFHPARAGERIGVVIPTVEVRRILTALGCRITKKIPGIFFVTPPWWRRSDLTAEHDLIEEVARFYGYQRIPSVLPVGILPAAATPARPPRTMFDVEQRAREVLADTGGTEVMAYSLTSRTAIERCGFSVEQCVALENPLSDDFAYLRPSLIPTILPIIAQNEGHAPNGSVFEIGKAYIPTISSSRAERSGAERSPIDRDFSTRLGLGRNDVKFGLPREEMRVLVAGYGDEGDALRVKGKIERMFAILGIRGAEFQVSGQCVLPQNDQLQASSFKLQARCLWHPGRTMDVILGEALVGTIGEIHPTVAAAAGIGHRVAVAELDWAAIAPHIGARGARQAPSQFPPAKRDIAFILDRRVPYADIAAFVAGSDPLLAGAELFDVFEGRGIPGWKKSVAFHLTYSMPDRTLTAEEVETVHAKLITKLQERFGAEMRT